LLRSCLVYTCLDLKQRKVISSSTFISYTHHVPFPIPFVINLMPDISATTLVRTIPKPQKKDKTYIKRQRLTRISALVPHDTHQRLASFEEARLKTDDDKLHARAGISADIADELGDICIVEGGIHFVEHEKWRWLVGMHSE
jgi:hypothetical protein